MEQLHTTDVEKELMFARRRLSSLVDEHGVLYKGPIGNVSIIEQPHRLVSNNTQKEYQARVFSEESGSNRREGFYIYDPRYDDAFDGYRNYYQKYYFDEMTVQCVEGEGDITDISFIEDRQLQLDYINTLSIILDSIEKRIESEREANAAKLRLKKLAKKQASTRRKRRLMEHWRENDVGYIMAIVSLGVVGIISSAAACGPNSDRKEEFEIAEVEINDEPGVIRLGETGKPTFSSTLYEDYMPEDVSNLADISWARDLQLGIVGQLLIEDYDDGLLCGEYEIPEDEGPFGLNSVVEAWTDNVDTNGTTLEDRIDITYTTEGIKACTDEDAPDTRVVLRIVEPQ